MVCPAPSSYSCLLPILPSGHRERETSVEAWLLPGSLEGGGEIRQKARTSGAKILGDYVSFSVSGNAARILRRLQGQDWEMKVTPNSLQDQQGSQTPPSPQLGSGEMIRGGGLGL